jgi:hypothetical protein
MIENVNLYPRRVADSMFTVWKRKKMATSLVPLLAIYCLFRLRIGDG